MRALRMMRAEAKADARVPASVAWARLADLEALAKWAPDVIDAPSDALRPGGKRRARLKTAVYGKDVLVERFVEVDAPRRTFTYDIEGGIGPMTAIRTTWSVVPAGTACTVHVASDLTVSGPARFVPFLVRRAWTRQLQVLADAFVAWADGGTRPTGDL